MSNKHSSKKITKEEKCFLSIYGTSFHPPLTPHQFSYRPIRSQQKTSAISVAMDKALSHLHLLWRDLRRFLVEQMSTTRFEPHCSSTFICVTDSPQAMCSALICTWLQSCLLLIYHYNFCWWHHSQHLQIQCDDDQLLKNDTAPLIIKSASGESPLFQIPQHLHIRGYHRDLLREYRLKRSISSTCIFWGCSRRTILSKNLVFYFILFYFTLYGVHPDTCGTPDNPLLLTQRCCRGSSGQQKIAGCSLPSLQELSS